jgi:hypothetical protein
MKCLMAGVFVTAPLQSRLGLGRVDAGRVDAGRVDAARVDAGRVGSQAAGGRCAAIIFAVAWHGVNPQKDLRRSHR